MNYFVDKNGYYGEFGGAFVPEMLQANITQLESRNQELDQFAYVVSHDLKAPLRGIESASRWIGRTWAKTRCRPTSASFWA